MDSLSLQPRHPSLPDHLSSEELASFIQKASVEKFTDFQKRFFSADEIAEMEHESSGNGRQINKLLGMLEDISTRIKKGNDEDIVITIPATAGTKAFDRFRRQNDDLIEKGYEEIETPIYGIVNTTNETMEYFTIDGQIIKERTRALSIKEQHQWLTAPGFRAKSLEDSNSGAALFIDK